MLGYAALTQPITSPPTADIHGSANPQAESTRTPLQGAYAIPTPHATLRRERADINFKLGESARLAVPARSVRDVT